MTIRVATGAGEGCGGGGPGRVKGDASALKNGGSGIVERDGGFKDGLGRVGEVNEGDGVGDDIEDPGLGRGAVGI